MNTAILKQYKISFYKLKVEYEIELRCKSPHEEFDSYLELQIPGIKYNQGCDMSYIDSIISGAEEPYDYDEINGLRVLISQNNTEFYLLPFASSTGQEELIWTIPTAAYRDIYTSWCEYVLANS